MGASIKANFIAGGGHVGKRLALALEDDHQVNVIEKNPRRANKIANDLHNTVVLLGDCADESLLLDESIDSADMFCAITDNDGVNIISALWQKAWGHEKRSVYLIIFRTQNYCLVPVLMSLCCLIRKRWAVF